MIAAINHLTGRHPASYQRGSLYSSHRKFFVNPKKHMAAPYWYCIDLLYSWCLSFKRQIYDFHCHTRRKRKVKYSEHWINILIIFSFARTNALIIDHWEVDSDLVSLEEEQGEGAFGKVYKGTIKQATTISRRLSVMPPVSPLRKSAITQAMPFTVAVKMLHGKFWVIIPYFFHSLRHRRNETLVKSGCETRPKSLIWAPTCVPGFESVGGTEQGSRLCFADVTKAWLRRRNFHVLNKFDFGATLGRHQIQTAHRVSSLLVSQVWQNFDRLCRTFAAPN